MLNKYLLYSSTGENIAAYINYYVFFSSLINIYINLHEFKRNALTKLVINKFV